MPRQRTNYYRRTYVFSDDFPQRLERFQREFGLSQPEIARGIETYRYTVWRRKEGRGRPNTKHMMALFDLGRRPGPRSYPTYPVRLMLFWEDWNRWEGDANGNGYLPPRQRQVLMTSGYRAPKGRPGMPGTWESPSPWRPWTTWTRRTRRADRARHLYLDLRRADQCPASWQVGRTGGLRCTATCTAPP